MCFGTWRFVFICRNMDTMIALVLYYITIVMFGKHEAAPSTEDHNNCIVSLVIPQDKIKSTCDEKGKTNMKMESLVSEITQVQRDISELHVRLAKILAKDDNSQDIKQLTERLEKLEKDKIPSLENRLLSLESEDKPKFTITRKRLTRVLKPMLQKELDDLRAGLAEEITKQLLSTLGGLTIGIPDNSQERITSEILYNKLRQEQAGAQLYHKQNVRNSYPEVTRKVVDLPEYRFSRRFDHQLDSLARQFRFESDQSALDNELPESGIPTPHFLQADSGFDPRIDRLIEIFKAELLENLDKQTEKVKTMTDRHMNEIEGKMSKILNIIEGLRTKYDSRLSQIAKVNPEGNTTSKIESLETDIKTLASAISALQSNFLADPQFKKLFQEELVDMQAALQRKFSDYNYPLRQEINYFKEKLEIEEREQHLTRTALQNFKADMRVTLHYVERNISTLNAVVNETLNPDYPGLSEEDIQHDSLVSSAVAFVHKMKDDWPFVFTNITQLEQLHTSDIDSVKTDYRDAQSKYDQLRDSHKILLDQIQTIQSSMEDFKNSLGEVERYTLNSALEDNKWVSYDFNHTSGRSNCNGGKKYVRKTGYDTGMFVGVVLCNATRYKIFLSDSLEETFLDIGDTGNFGEDHCEFVGASKLSVITVEKSRHQFERKPGFYRYDWGQTPTKGKLSFFSPSPSWYECGISIP